MSTTAFYLLAASTVVAALGVVVLRNPVHCAMSLVVSLFLVAVNYASLHAHLVAALQIIVYAGAIMVLFLFVIMLLNLQAEERAAVKPGTFVLPIACASAVALLLIRAISTSALLAGPDTVPPPEFGTTKALARVLFREDVVAFELTSFMLLVAVVGAVVLARRERG